MTEEEKAAITAEAEAEAQAKAEAEKAKDNSGETEEEKTSREARELEEQNYKTELEREKKRNEEKDRIIAEQAFKLRDKKRDEKADDNDDKPLTKKDLEVMLENERQNSRRELQSEIISEKAKKMAGSESEASLIIEIHKNRVFPKDLSIDEQLEEAYAIANRKKLIKQNEELKRALAGKDTASNNDAGTHRDSTPLEESKMSSNDVGALKAVGFAWDGKSRLYIKNLGKNKVLTYDPKTKTQKIVEK